jgi:predicted DsbA family dithiol-disulfide isomerase
MTQEPVQITFFFDFRCPFCYRTVEWIYDVQRQLGASLQIDWKYFSLEQINAPADSGWKIWEQDEDYADLSGRGQRNRVLLAFWAAEAARQQGRDAGDRFRMALYHARHRDHRDYTNRAVVEEIAAESELDMERFRRDFADRSMVDALQRDHEEAIERYKAFGVPTICFDEHTCIFVRMMAVPDPADAVPAFHELRSQFTNPRRAWLAEIKRTRQGKLH